MLLSAQVLPPGPAERHYILPVRAVVHLLFSRPIDPMTLAPQHFVLALGDGRRVAPVGAFLTPGTGPGEQRSVALSIAAPPAPTDKAAVVTAPAEPFSLTITGLLHDASGRVLEGLALDIRPSSEPVVPVRAEPGPATACAGRGQALRVFWSGPVISPASNPAPTPVVLRMDGTRGPAEVVGAGTARPLLDLCAPGVAGVQGVEFAAGVMLDERGLPTAAGSLTISPAP